MLTGFLLIFIKNLQLASTGDSTYVFKWPGGLLQEETIELYDESNYPGRLPEPVTLAGPEDGAFVDADGALFSCWLEMIFKPLLSQARKVYCLI